MINTATVWGQSSLWIKVGWLIGCIFGWPVRCVGRPDSLFVILSGSLGDALLFSGALREIRRATTGRHIVLLLPERAYPLLARCPHVDEIFAPSMHTGVWHSLARVGTAVRLFLRRYDIVLCPALIKGEDSEFIAYLARARRRVLMEWRSTTVLPQNYREEWKPHETFLSQEPHELDRTVLFMQAAGFNGVKSRKEIWPETYVTDGERASVRQEIERYRQENPNTLVVSVCAGARFKQKDWGTNNFIELLSRLGQTNPIIVILLGSAEDCLVNTVIESGVNGITGVRVLDTTAKVGLFFAMAYIAESDICLGNDTFGLHVAITFGTLSVVVMWGGDNERWAPWGDPIRHRMVRSRDQSCFGCRGQCQGSEYRCMRSIRVDEVVGEVNDLIAVMRQSGIQKSSQK